MSSYSTSTEQSTSGDLVSRLGSFFSPKHVAVVGASEKSNWTRNLFHNLEGACLVTPVHPRHEQVFGRRVASSLQAATEDRSVDMAFVLTGSDRVPSVLEEAAEAGIRNIVVLASDYDDDGSQSHAQRRQLRDLVAELGLTMLGPNTIGFINAQRGLAPWASLDEGTPLAGGLGAAFESGSVARACLEFSRAHGIGSTIWAAMGNAAALSTMDVVEYLVHDEETRAIAVFLESVREPDRLIELAHAAAERLKPIVVLKAGRSEKGKRAAMAHTGAIASDDAVVDAVFRQHGILRAGSIEELVTTAGLLAQLSKPLSGRRMGVVTSSGGGCNLIADLAADHDIELPPWRDTTVRQLNEVLPDDVPTFNPLDTTGFGHSRPRPRPTKAEDDLLEIAGEDSGIDFMYSMMTPLPSEPPDDPTAIESRLAILSQIVAECPVPVFLSSNTCLDMTPYQQQLLSNNGLHVMPGADLAMKAIRHVVDWSGWRNDRLMSLPEQAPTRDPDLEDPLDDVRTANWGGLWDEVRGRQLLEAHRVPLVPAVLASTEEAAIAAAQQFGDGPVAMKVCSADVPHKSDVGGVALGVKADEVAARYSQLLAAVEAGEPEAAVRGVLVSPMRPEAVDLFVGVRVDDTFGPVLAVGLGGVWVEVLEDVALRALPVDPATVKNMLLELRGAPLLRGARGTQAVDLDSLAEVIVRISRAATDMGPMLESLEVNPLRVGPRIEALDVLVSTAHHDSSVAHEGRGQQVAVAPRQGR